MYAYYESGVQPDILAAIWYKETDYDTGMTVTDNFKRDKNGDRIVASRDYGPLQINDYWKLNRATWQRVYNPRGYDLKSDPWESFMAGVRDIAGNGGRVPGAWDVVAKYWHGPQSPDIDKYVDEVGKAYVYTNMYFECLRERGQL